MADGSFGNKTGRHHYSRPDEKEMSLVPARWDIIAEAVKIRNEFDSSANHTLILGNGDVKSVTDAEEKTRISGVDGVMIGRAVFGNPWPVLRKSTMPGARKAGHHGRSTFYSS